MPVYGQSPWADASVAMQGVGGSMANLAHAQLSGRLRAQQMMQQQAYQQAQLALARQREARMQQSMDQQDQFHMASAAKAQQETGDMQQASDMANLVMQLRASQGAMQSPSLNSNAQVLNPAALAMRQAGALPQGEVAMPRAQFESLIPQVIQAVMMRQAAMSPASAASMARPVEMSPGQNLVDPITRQTLLQVPPASKLQQVAPGASLFDAEQGTNVFTAPESPYHIGMIDARQHQMDMQRAYQEGMLAARTRGLNIQEASAGSNPGLLDFQKNLNSVEDANGVVNSTQNKRIRVKAPDGRTGTIQQGDTIPDGWTTIQ